MGRGQRYLLGVGVKWVWEDWWKWRVAGRERIGGTPRCPVPVCVRTEGWVGAFLPRVILQHLAITLHLFHPLILSPTNPMLRYHPIKSIITHPISPPTHLPPFPPTPAAPPFSFLAYPTCCVLQVPPLLSLSPSSSCITADVTLYKSRRFLWRHLRNLHILCSWEW